MTEKFLFFNYNRLSFFFHEQLEIFLKCCTFIPYNLNSKSCADRFLFDRKGSYTGSTNLRLKWVVCSQQCKKRLILLVQRLYDSESSLVNSFLKRTTRVVDICDLLNFSFILKLIADSSAYQSKDCFLSSVQYHTSLNSSALPQDAEQIEWSSFAFRHSNIQVSEHSSRLIAVNLKLFSLQHLNECVS